MIVKVTPVKCWYMGFVLAYLLDWEGKRNTAAQNSRQDILERNYLFVPSCFTDHTWLLSKSIILQKPCSLLCLFWFNSSISICPVLSTIETSHSFCLGAECWSEHGADTAKVSGLIPAWAFPLGAGLEDPCGFLPAQNILCVWFHVFHRASFCFKFLQLQKLRERNGIKVLLVSVRSSECHVLGKFGLDPSFSGQTCFILCWN